MLYKIRGAAPVTAVCNMKGTFFFQFSVGTHLQCLKSRAAVISMVMGILSRNFERSFEEHKFASITVFATYFQTNGTFFITKMLSFAWSRKASSF